MAVAGAALSLSAYLSHFGPADSEQYQRLSARADVVVSAARHGYVGIDVVVPEPG